MTERMTDTKIYEDLLANPKMMYVNKSRQKVYLLGDDKKTMYVFSGDFRKKTDAEINQIVCVMMEHC